MGFNRSQSSGMMRGSCADGGDSRGGGERRDGLPRSWTEPPRLLVRGAFFLFLKADAGASNKSWVGCRRTGQKRSVRRQGGEERRSKGGSKSKGTTG